ncbi:uncharacterized protein [Anabrus simplex]|uniref:uncharacterized protein n=1 Tax=Anabrus simplex TaxID=316456 RepID=UPI0035A3B06F
MWNLSLFIVSPLLVWSVIAIEEQDFSRDPRWFLGGNTITKFVLDNKAVTEITPSSCVVVQPSLPPCKSLRALSVDSSPPTRVETTKLVELHEIGDVEAIRSKTLGRSWYRYGSVVETSEPVIQTTPIAPTAMTAGWWGKDVTVTSTIYASETLKLQDPKHVVTFSVTGCKPSRMPFDLDYCDKSPQNELP